MQQPEGFILPGKEHLVCRLDNCHGLKQSPRKWNQKFNSFLIQFRLSHSTVDQCIYFSRSEDPDDFIILVIWVDDGLIASSPKTKAQDIIQFLETQFEMMSGPTKSFIGPRNFERSSQQEDIRNSVPLHLSSIGMV